MVLDLDLQAASQWMLEPPDFRVLTQDSRGRVVTHIAASGEFDGPYPFHEGGQLID